MRPISISNLNPGPAVRALNPDLFPDDAPLCDAVNEPVVAIAKPTKLEIKVEKELQTVSEQWLHHRGYINLSASNAVRQLPALPRGWFGHMYKPVGNPFMPDLFIFNPLMDRCLMIELKVRDVFQPGQREMFEAGAWELCWTFAEVETVVVKWE